MTRTLPLVAAALLGLALLAPSVPVWAYPKPSVYPVSWELKFRHGDPRRIVVTLPGTTTPRAYWYVTYSVTNTGANPDADSRNKDIDFLPSFELVSMEGQVLTAGLEATEDGGRRPIQSVVFDAIKAREGNKYLEPHSKAIGRLLVGEDQTRDSVAIWSEPSPDMGRFSIFISGLAGEAELFKRVGNDFLKVDTAQEIKDAKPGDLSMMRKTLQLTYELSGRAGPGNEKADPVREEWIMRQDAAIGARPARGGAAGTVTAPPATRPATQP